MNLNKTKTVQTTIVNYWEISGDDIREAFNLPSNARVFFDVPSGNWSGERIDIDDYYKIYVNHTEVVDG